MSTCFQEIYKRLVLFLFIHFFFFFFFNKIDRSKPLLRIMYLWLRDKKVLMLNFICKIGTNEIRRDTALINRDIQQ